MNLDRRKDRAEVHRKAVERAGLASIAERMPGVDGLELNMQDAGCQLVRLIPMGLSYVQEYVHLFPNAFQMRQNACQICAKHSKAFHICIPNAFKCVRNRSKCFQMRSKCNQMLSKCVPNESKCIQIVSNSSKFVQMRPNVLQIHFNCVQMHPNSLRMFPNKFPRWERILNAFAIPD